MPVKAYFPKPPEPPTLADLMKAIEGYRNQLDSFGLVVSMDLIRLRENVERHIERERKKP